MQKEMSGIFKFLFLLFFFTLKVYAQLDLGSWMNPGPLAQPHESLEGIKNCTTCHATARGVPDQKCLICHLEIQQRLAQKRGYHARQTQQCIACHNEHKGKTYDLAGLSRLLFDHGDTGWPLTGGHIKAECRKCHTQARTNVQTKQLSQRPTYLDTKTDCLSCHADPHNSEDIDFKKCQRCHTTVDWEKPKSRMNFNHNQETEFKLTGAHVRVNCYDCHKKKVWKPLPHSQCTDCHVDPHNGQFGIKCEDCHNTTTWRKAFTKEGGSKTFDHNKTRFPLTGQHKEVSCKRCHGPVIGKMSGFEQCRGCHNNPHGNQFKELWKVQKECTACHLTDGWNILSFQHNRDSRYELVEKHKLVPCEQCHIDRKYRWLTKTPDCDTCHQDVHRGQFSKICAQCHTQKGFGDLIFDHNRDSPFPLVGKHQYVNCSRCHLEGRYKGIDRSCQGCHGDFHKGELGQECTRCHSPVAFNEVEFDHNRESRFKLDGEHVKNQCNQCHLDYRYKFPSFECATCHLDVHQGSFGSSCERCHMTSSFTVRTGFHDFGEFSLGGAHDRVDCLVCHGPKSAIRPSQTQCSSCHKDPHMNSLGHACYNCHTQFKWLPSTFRHNQTGFELSGAHRFLSCDRCHFNRVFGGLPQDCPFCHTKDFKNPSIFPPHQGAVGLPCNNCHFTFGWRPTR